MRPLGTIGGVTVFINDEIDPPFTEKEIVNFVSDADIDADGSGGNPDRDPYFQPDTTLHDPIGRPLNAQEVRFIVVPPLICQKTKGKVLGSRCYVLNTSNDKFCDAVVGDIGPRSKTGELSPACAAALGLNPNANHGGTDRKIISYTIYVGQPATLDGVTYELKSYGA
jgi:hypothetical protein